MTFTITRSGNLDVATTIHPWTQDITATHKVDYVNILSTNSPTIVAGETSKTVTVQIKPDIYHELDETSGSGSPTQTSEIQTSESAPSSTATHPQVPTLSRSTTSA